MPDLRFFLYPTSSRDTEQVSCCQSQDPDYVPALDQALTEARTNDGWSIIDQEQPAWFGLVAAGVPLDVALALAASVDSVPAS
ncbi:hypothetical protein PO878_10990 [Iamia majanohamensis]|uniref:Uncharacterized protein n=1 Tax=Iamia majanohamensis TaxID=467976 RepID=A0AAE9Y6A6_9ACTN|nr:hypothetical protein [Iamia majanohamensis]WCO65024.1 hypothetical protein PO878_10990 [Iamia majanohamensis]